MRSRKLTPRQREILILITQGCSNKQIAIKLGIREQSVRNQVTKILRRLGVVNRTEAAVLALRKGLVQ
jgi:DNA-binding NarL/FixJ family response regulator